MTTHPNPTAQQLAEKCATAIREQGGTPGKISSAIWEGFGHYATARIILRELNLEELLRDRERLLETVKWIASQKNLFFAECSQAEAIIERCQNDIAAISISSMWDMNHPDSKSQPKITGDE